MEQPSNQEEINQYLLKQSIVQEVKLNVLIELATKTYARTFGISTVEASEEVATSITVALSKYKSSSQQ